MHNKLPNILLGGGIALCVVSAIIGWILAPLWTNNRLMEEALQKKLTGDVSYTLSALQDQDEYQNPSLSREKTWKEWVGLEHPFDLYLKIYLFNVSNPEAVKNGEKPILHEVGPFVYRQERLKLNVTVNDKSGAIFYNDTRRFFFVPELSLGKEEDLVTVINIPFIGLSKEISELSKMVQFTVTMILDEIREEVFITKTVNELLFGGYHQKVVALLSQVTSTEYLPNDSIFGIFHERNDSDFGNYEIDSGLNDVSKFSEIASWNGRKKLEWWDTDECSKIEGTDGLIFPPFITQKSVLKIFKPEFCRVFPLKFSEVNDYYGVETFKFVLNEEVYQDPRKNPNNMCFCTPHSRNRDECPTDGAYQISACQNDSPMYLSLPHFLFGPLYANQSDGFYPDTEKHQTFVEVEPITGTVIKSSFRIQANLELKPHKGLNKVPHILMPFMWQEETAIITPEAAGRLFKITKTPFLASKVSSTVGLGNGLLLILIALLIFILRAKNSTNYTGGRGQQMENSFCI